MSTVVAAPLGTLFRVGIAALALGVWAAPARADGDEVPRGDAPKVFQDDFDASSCLRASDLSGWLDDSGELVLSMSGGAGQGLRTTTNLGYGRYTARIRTDTGAGAVVAFYLMSIGNDERNDPAYRQYHDEVDFELVNTLWRESKPVADSVTWFNAFRGHVTIVLPRNRHDDAGGSMLALAAQATDDDALFNRNVLPDLDRASHFIGPNFDDGQFYTYTIDYDADRIIYTVETSSGALVKRYTLRRTSDAWPKLSMYLALSIWSAGNAGTEYNFTGPLDRGFGRPMRAYVDHVRYEPAAGVEIPGADRWNGRIPWLSCGFAPPGDCRAYNRDGVTCREVGFADAQVGRPWGTAGGVFRCVDGCLQWLGP